jgi:23S rRNA (uracil1939-C5)-methyltransferase
MSSLSCPHHPTCPGCPLLSLSPAEQLAAKQAAAAQALGLYPELQPVSPAKIVGAERLVDYRVRAKLVADRGKLGLYRERSHEVVDIPECRVLRPALRALANDLRGSLPSEVTGVDLREADSGALVTLIARRGASRERLTAFAQGLAERLPGVRGVALSLRDPESPQLLGDEPVVVWGEAELEHHFVKEAPYHLAAPGSFTQVHPEQAAELHARIERGLAERLGTLEGRRLLELHSGSGLLGLRLARAGASATLVEAFEPAVARAVQAARAQGLSIEARAGDAVAFCENAFSHGERFDALLVNPPRRGLEAKLRECLAGLAPRALIYVSCAPDTFARDAAHLARLGYRLARVTPFDLIPLSDAVELLGEFVPAEAPDPRILHQDDVLIAVEKSGLEPLVARGASPSLEQRVRRLPGAEDAVPVEQLDVGTSGACLFATSPSKVAEIKSALRVGESRYLALAKGITHDKGNVKRPLGQAGRGAPALTRYARKKIVSGHSLLEVRPEVGASEQIVRHLSSLGHPVVGDRHGDRPTNAYFWHKHGLDRSFLHRTRARLTLGGREIEIRSDLAPDLARVLDAAR